MCVFVCVVKGVWFSVAVGRMHCACWDERGMAEVEEAGRGAGFGGLRRRKQ